MKKGMLVSIILFLVLNLLHLTQWFLVDYLTVFLMPILFLFLYVIFIIFSVINIVRAIKNKFCKDYIMIISINILTIFSILLIPYTDIYVKVDDYRNRQKRIAFIEQNFELLKNIDRFEVPEKYGSISSGGNLILIDNSEYDIKILFFTFRGILDNFSGYVYSVKDIAPESGDFGADIFQCKKITDNWYWLSSR